MAGPHPRRARGVLWAAFAVFALGAAWALVAAVPLAGALTQDAVSLSQELDAARDRAQPEFTARVDRTRSAVTSAGWGLGPAAPLPSFDCWQQGNTTACDLFAHADGQAPMPVAQDQRTAALERLLAVTNAALAEDGWRCTRLLTAADAADAAVTDCTSGTTQLRVSFRTGAGADTALTEPAALNRVELRLDLSDRAYRSGGGTT